MEKLIDYLHEQGWKLFCDGEWGRWPMRIYQIAGATRMHLIGVINMGDHGYDVVKLCPRDTLPEVQAWIAEGVD